MGKGSQIDLGGAASRGGPDMNSLRVALVHDWLITRGGGEQVLEALVHLFPNADVFTLLHDPRSFIGSGLARPVFASALQRLPGATRYHRLLVALMPWAVERLDLSSYELVISSSSAVAHGVRTRPDQIHINYIHAPMRYAWSIEDSLALWGWSHGLRGWAAAILLARLREWDRRVVARVDHFVANSRHTAEAVQRCYQRTARVVYPPVRTQLFTPVLEREPFFVTLARLVPHKRIDLIVEAFNQLGLPLKVVGNGPEYPRLRRLAKPNISFLPSAGDIEVAALLGQARAFVFAGVEDFGIAVVEAQAAGCPVIAYGRGGVTETVIPEITGVLYERQTVAAICAAVESFESRASQFDATAIRAHAEEFSAAVFEKAMRDLLEEILPV